MRAGPPVASIVVVAAFAACTLEHRPDRDPDPVVRAVVDLAVRPALEDSVRTVAAAFQEAVRRGDASRALALLHPGSVVLLGGGRPRSRAEFGEGLAGGRLAGFGEFSGWTVEQTDVTLLGDAALVVSRLGAPASGGADTVSGRARATESLVLVRSAAGWLIRHVHRSEVPVDG